MTDFHYKFGDGQHINSARALKITIEKFSKLKIYVHEIINSHFFTGDWHFDEQYGYKWKNSTEMHDFF